MSGIRRLISYCLSAALSAALAACALPSVQPNSYSVPTARQSATAQVPAEVRPSCSVNAVKICQDNARERPPLFFPDAIKGQSAANPSNLMAFDAPLQIPGGPQLKVACYYRPGSMAVVYARAWALVAGNQLVTSIPRRDRCSIRRTRPQRHRSNNAITNSCASTGIVCRRKECVCICLQLTMVVTTRPR